MRIIHVANGDRQCGRCAGRMNWNCGAVGSTEHPIACLSCVSASQPVDFNWKLDWMAAAQRAVDPDVGPHTYDDDIPF